MEINWTDPALDDLDAIFEFIGRDAPAYANHFIQQILGAADRLAHTVVACRITRSMRSNMNKSVAVTSSTTLEPRLYWVKLPCREHQRLEVRKLIDPGT